MLKLFFRNIGLKLDEKFNLELRKLYRVRFYLLNKGKGRSDVGKTICVFVSVM